MRVEVVTQKAINPPQLKDELGRDIFTSEDGRVQAEGVTEAQLQAAVDAHLADPDYIPPGPEKDWRAKLRAEVAFINDQIATWPADATTNAQALQRVNFLLAATKRIARNQARIMQFIDNATMDSDA